MSELARAYFKFYHGDKTYEWAQNAVEEIFQEKVDPAWGITLELVNSAPTWASLSYIGAGQIEILCGECGSDVIERIKKEAKTNDRLLYAMRSANLVKDNPIFDEFYSFIREEAKLREPTKWIDMPQRLKSDVPF